VTHHHVTVAHHHVILSLSKDGPATDDYVGIESEIDRRIAEHNLGITRTAYKAREDGTHGEMIACPSFDRLRMTSWRATVTWWRVTVTLWRVTVTLWLATVTRVR